MLNTSLPEPNQIQIVEKTKQTNQQAKPPKTFKITSFCHCHCFTDSFHHRFSPKGRLKIVLPSFPARVVRGEPHLWVV